MMEPILVKGAPGSPYTRKMVALLRYQQLPYRFLIGSHENDLGLPRPKVALLPTLYLRDERGEIEAVVDSTPLIRRLDATWPGPRSVLPPDPVVRFVDELIEDYADEWLTKAMFHYRWHGSADIDHAGNILPRWRAITASEEEIAQLRARFSRRQIDRLGVVGSNAITAPVIEESYRRFLGCLNQILSEQPFILGARPGSADLATYGQLTQLAHFDPTPRSLTLAEAPRVFAWVDVMDDLSGLDVQSEGWLARNDLARVLTPLLTEIGRTYVPVMMANARAIDQGASQVEAVVSGAPWTQTPFPYQARCLAALRVNYARLEPQDRADLEPLL
ncbi:MAG TPA: glutathione S-transferase, partial [Gammaproteobacteria bacterium]|nr:glutathione S-transferase [Gammaproteobacteria bacterium]